MFRAPEVVLKLPWSFPADMWSIGCIFLEIHHGRMLFDTHHSIDHLNQMTKCIEEMPEDIMNQTSDEIWTEYFHSNGSLRLEDAKISKNQCKNLMEYFDLKKEYQTELFDLISNLLSWEDIVRPTAAECLAHPYFEIESFEEHVDSCD